MRSSRNADRKVPESDESPKPRRDRNGKLRKHSWGNTPIHTSGRKKGRLAALPEYLKPYLFSKTYQPDPAKKRTTTSDFQRMCRERTTWALNNIIQIADLNSGFKGNVILDANMYIVDHAVGKAVQGLAIALQHLDRDGAVLSPDDPNYVPDSRARPLTLEEKLKWSTVLLGSLSEVKGLPENVQKLIASHMGKLNGSNSGGAEEAEVISTTSKSNGNGKAPSTH